MTDDTISTTAEAPDTGRRRQLKEAILAYRDDMRDFISDPTRNDIPDISGVIKAARQLPGTTLRDPQKGSDSVGSYVSAFVDPTTRAPMSRPCRFSHWEFAYMLWFALGRTHGFRINYVNPGDKDRHYVNLRTGLVPNLGYRTDNLSLRRIIMNPDKGNVVPDKGNYHDYRAPALRVTGANDLAEAVPDYDINTPYRARDVLIKYLEAAQRLRLADLGISREDFVKTMDEMMKLADQMNARYYGKPSRG